VTESLSQGLNDSLVANGLPYGLPIHPNLVHLSSGVFAIAIACDGAGALYPVV